MDRYVLKEPVGVVAAIVPWNFPMQIQLAKIGPALCGRLHGRPQGCSRYALDFHAIGSNCSRGNGSAARRPQRLVGIPK